MEAKYLEDWLRDAHAMEKQAEEMLKAQLKVGPFQKSLFQGLKKELRQFLTAEF